MRKFITTTVVLLVALISYFGFSKVKQAREIGPAREAVLAMTTDQDRPPVQGEQLPTRPATQPNIIVILADDLGWRDVGYNQSDVRTPVIDSLAAEGVTFNRFYAQPSCSPTRAALLTGKSPLRLGVLGPLSKNNPAGLPLSEQTLADYLKAAGYQTALTGKWHLGPRNLAYHPNARGFDHFYGNLTGGVGYYDKVHGGGYDWQRNGETVREEGYTTRLIAREAVKLIETRDPARPLFLYAAFGAPHLPNEAPQETVTTYSSIRNKNRRKHAAMVSELDFAIGEIHAALVSQGIEDNTLIWFMSDNGGLVPKFPLGNLPEPIFRKALEIRFKVEANETFVAFARTNLRDGGSDNRPFKGGKQSVFEGGVRVPSFVYWQGEIKPGHYNYMATIQDVMPTLLDVGGVSADSSFDGQSLWGAIMSDAPAPPLDYIVHASQAEQSLAIYRYPYKLIPNGNDYELFDLEADPLEARNLAGKHPALVAELSATLDAFPRGKSVLLGVQEVADDPDFFGGEEDRVPWADQASVAGN